MNLPVRWPRSLTTRRFRYDSARRRHRFRDGTGPSGRPSFALLMSFVWLGACGLVGCATTASGAGGSPATAPSPKAAAVPPPAQQPPSPQSAAADALVQQGRKLFKARNYEAALGRLERAMSVNPRHGAGHYWLAEVWRAKGDLQQAREHHRLAKRYLSGRTDWQGRIVKQGDSLNR